MPRHKDVEWNLPEGVPAPGGGRTHQWEAIHTALLMDIRDELKRLNAVLHCVNFQRIPRYLQRIAGNTAKKRKARGRR